MTAPDESFDLFCAEIAPHRAVVYARADKPEGEGWRLDGRIRGPFCRFAGTLPANGALADAGPGPTLLARGLVADPALWTPDSPQWYEARVECRRGDEVAFQSNRRFAVRQFVADRRGFLLSGRRYVLRAARASLAPEAPLETWRDAPLTRVDEIDSSEIWSTALEAGVLHVVDRSPSATDAQAIARIARHSAVGMIVLGRNRPSLKEIRAAAPNLLVALREPPHEAESPDAWWVDPPSTMEIAQRWMSRGQPVVVERRLSSPTSPSAARLACDALQSDLAPWAQFAGYVV